MESEQSSKQSLSKSETIQQLRTTINQLEGIIEELDTTNVEQLPESPSLETLVKTTEELESTISKAKQTPSPVKEETTITEIPEAKPQESPEAETPEVTSTPETAQPPESQTNKSLSVGIVAAVAIALILIGLQFLPTNPGGIISSSSKASGKLATNPELNFIAAIEKQVETLTTSYEPDLITLIKPDFKNNTLFVTVDDQWYELKSDRQQQVSNEINKRSRPIEFQKLIIQDRKGKLLARNPVVGDNMVIFQSSNDL